MKKIFYSITFVALFAAGTVATNAKLNIKGMSGAKKGKTTQTGCTLEALATSGLGDVKYSVLSLAKFQAVNGPEWVLLDGQSKTTIESSIEPGNNSVFSYFDVNNYDLNSLPSAGGTFLRARNMARTSNPAGVLRLGEFQTDTFKTHYHSMGTKALALTGGNIVVGDPNQQAMTGTTYTNAAGDDETRPRNLTVNVFVKVKRKCIDDVIKTQLDQHNTDIQALQTFNSQNQCDACLTMPEGDLTQFRAKNVCFKAEVDAFENDQRAWSVTCIARTVGYSKKVLMLIGAPNRTQDEIDYLTHLDNQYPYYNVISTN
ncbi:MAG: hypothetical protein HYV97_16620 [Bdellovibrio sp.]|nr:hypothetical protein [Bdellovibrio sp.]